MDDSSSSLSASVALNGITSIGPGESVIFIETADLAGKASLFKTIWFGDNPPAGLQIGSYTGSGVGLSNDGDAVNLMTSTGAIQASVSFGGSSIGTLIPTFDNGVGTDNGVLTAFSTAPIRGAFFAANDSKEVGSPGTTQGKVFISEVAPYASGNSAVSSDWFELTNGTNATVTISGWTVDDNSFTRGNSLPLLGVTSLASGESAIFIETDTSLVGESAAGNRTLFINTWFGGTLPVGLQIGNYTGSGIGFSTGGDGVVIYTGTAPSATEIDRVTFGSASTGNPYRTFDNSADATALTLFSVVGVNAAFASTDSVEVGSPGIVSLSKPGPVIPIRINEVESNGSGDFIELINTSTSPFDATGLKLLDATTGSTVYSIPTTPAINGGGLLLITETDLAGYFTLESADSVRLLATDGVNVVDTFSWLEHSSTTYGRCPDSGGVFITNLVPTPNAVNSCPAYSAWPGSQSVAGASANGVFGGNLSGLIYEDGTPDVLWAVRNGGTGVNTNSRLYRLLYNGTIWTMDTANNWGAGKPLHFTSGSGDIDSEGVTFTTGSAAGIYIASERDNSNSGTSRPSVLRFDPAGSATELTANKEWLLTGLPTLGANLGPEAITWVPDSFLVSKGFKDDAGVVYNPASYPDHAGGLFFVGIENNGFIYAFALNHTTNTATRVATIDSGFPAVMELQFDRDTQDFWAFCDDTCQGRSAVLQIVNGNYTVVARYERPAGMPNTNNEGFVAAPQSECSAGFKPAFWADDNERDGISIRQGTLPCGDIDLDDDGFTNADETGSADTPPGNLIGSNPNNAASTPETCDGIDNDLNEGIDEGFTNTDGDSLKDCVDPDDDNDGFSDASEIGSAGTPPGNVVGSNPNLAASTPETCDGLDNDLNEGVDEGFTNTDGDSQKDCVDPDDDNDGIDDVSDPAPTAFGPPVDKDACKDNGFKKFVFPKVFKNQGDCVSYVATGGKNQ